MSKSPSALLTPCSTASGVSTYWIHRPGQFHQRLARRGVRAANPHRDLGVASAQARGDLASRELIDEPELCEEAGLRVLNRTPPQHSAPTASDVRRRRLAVARLYFGGRHPHPPWVARWFAGRVGLTFGPPFPTLLACSRAAAGGATSSSGVITSLRARIAGQSKSMSGCCSSWCESRPRPAATGKGDARAVRYHTTAAADRPAIACIRKVFSIPRRSRVSRRNGTAQ